VKIILKHWKGKHGISVPGVNTERTGKFAFLPQGTLGTQLSQCEKHKSHGKIV
jgi:hypothetical protein